MDEELDQDSEELDDDTSSEDDVQSDEDTDDTNKRDTQETLFEIPGGRKVDANTLVKEWNENFMPDYTRKSQELAKIKGQQPPSEDKAPFEDPNYKPTDYAQYAKDIISWLKKQQLVETEQAQKIQQDAKQQVDNFVAEAKKSDKDFDEKDFADYAIRHKFRIDTMDELKGVYSAYKETRDADTGEKTSDKTRVNIKGGGGEPSGPKFSDIRAKGGSIFDQAMEALQRIKK